jgi:hypothetical protein
MKNHRYILEPYNGSKSRYTCQRCGKERSFCRYLDTESKEYLSPNVGRCNREVKCGYHYTPKQFFIDHTPIHFTPIHNYKEKDSVPSKAELPTSCIPFEYLEKSLNHYKSNNLVKYLLNLFGAIETEKVVSQYLVGTSKYWDGATTFWQINQKGKIRTGKVMHFDTNTGHRTKKPYSLINWVHKILKLQDYNLVQCFFGEHLLSIHPEKHISIVESEKTALIASIYFPQFVWLATGGKNGCKWTTWDVCKVLKGRKIILWPDINAYEDWNRKALTLTKLGYLVVVSDLLEQNATREERTSGYDLADFLIRIPLNSFLDQYR